MTDPLLLAVTKVTTLQDQQHLTNASGFFYSCGEQLFLVTSRHVLRDDTSSHYPDRILIELHTDANNLAQSVDFSIPLYRDGTSIWRQGADEGGSVDVAAIEVDRNALPAGVTYRSFDLNHMIGMRGVEIGTALLIVGFPLGFHDTLHHLPVARHGIAASCFDLRFQGQGYFLTDARTHRGMSGAPVVVRSSSDTGPESDFKWMLAGIHSARLDVGTRDLQLDETLGLNCAWFADILPTLTATMRPPRTV
ncbi:MAG: trypsin-like peptidase domain-containing protein [Gammaproteobacteria bacterium]|jgi:S1-C subfamily serine protease